MVTNNNNIIGGIAQAKRHITIKLIGRKYDKFPLRP